MMNIASVFLEQAEVCGKLGSPFTADLLRLIPDLLDGGDPVVRRIDDWPGDASGAHDNVPLRLAGGLHALVRSGRDPALAAMYPPGNQPNRETLLTTVAQAFRVHADFLLDWLKLAPQTNDVGRSAVLIAAGNLLTRLHGKPLKLLELGTSAGLNLQWDRYALKAAGRLFGSGDAKLKLAPEWRGDVPSSAAPRITGREGVDLNPLDVAAEDDRLRLLSYIWPDQPARLARVETAIDIAREHPVRLNRGDAARWLEERLAGNDDEKGSLTVVFHTTAWQYFSLETQNRLNTTIAGAGARATADAPLARFSMEADERDDSAALALTLWPGKVAIDLGRADFHGRWVDWRESE